MDSKNLTLPALTWSFEDLCIGIMFISSRGRFVHLRKKGQKDEAYTEEEVFHMEF